MAAEGGAYGDGRVGTCDAMSLIYEGCLLFLFEGWGLCGGEPGEDHRNCDYDCCATCGIGQRTRNSLTGGKHET